MCFWRKYAVNPVGQKDTTAIMYNYYVQFSTVLSLDWLGHRGNMGDNSADILFQSFLQEANLSSSGMGRDVHSIFNVVHPVFRLPTTASPTLQGALMDGFREAVVACDMPEQVSVSWQLPERGSCGVGDAENFSQALGPRFTAVGRMEVTRDVQSLYRLCIELLLGHLAPLTVMCL